MWFRALALLLLWNVATLPAVFAQQRVPVKVMSFNILSGGNSTFLNLDSPLHYQPRYDEIARAILDTGADVVGIQENNNPGELLPRLQAADPNWDRRGAIYSRYPLEPVIPGNSDTTLARVLLSPAGSLVVHNAHWRPPNGGYGPFFAQNKIINGQPVVESEILDAARNTAAYQGTLNKVQSFINAGETVVVTGDFNEPSHLDWTNDYAQNGADRWVNNASGTPLTQKIAWEGSQVLGNGGLLDAYRTYFRDEVAKPGNTWTPAYANGTQGRRSYDLDYSGAGPIPANQVLDRIDRIYFSGPGVRVTDAAVISGQVTLGGVQSPDNADVVLAMEWPSDHRAVTATLEVPAANPLTRDSTNFVSTIDQIEGDVDPATLGSFSNIGTPNVTVNGDGTLTLITPNDAFPAWGWTTPTDLVSSATGWTWETRFRIDSANAANRGVWEIFLRDRDGGSLSATRIHFLSTGLDRDAAGFGVNAEVPADLTDRFHTVRGAVEGGTNLSTVWLDGEKVIDALPSNTFNADEFARIGRWGGQTGGGTTTIDYIRFDTTGAYAPPLPTTKTWAVDGSGDWNTTENWVGGVPDSNEHTVVFGDVITSARTVYTDTAVTVKHVRFDSANTYRIAGDTVTIESNDPVADPSKIEVLSGDHEFQAKVTLVNDVEVTVAAGASLTFHNYLDVGPNTLMQNGDGALVINTDVTGTGTIVAAAGALAGTGTIAGKLTVGADFIFDLDDGSDLAEGGKPMVVTDRLILAPWKLVLNGDGRTEAITPADKFPVFRFGTLATGSLPAGPEDLNGDGVVGDADLNLMLSNLGTTGGTPGGLGDVTGDGDVNQADLDQLLAAFGNGGSGTVREPYNAVIELGTGTSGWDTTGWDLVVEGNQLLLTGISSTGGAAAVPEPATMVLLLLGALGLVSAVRRHAPRREAFSRNRLDL